MFLLGGLWHMSIMNTFYEEHSAASPLNEPKLQFIVLGYLILGFLMAYIFPKGYRGGGAVGEGLRFGAVIGLLWVLPHAVVLHGVEFGAMGELILVDAVWHMVEQGVGGVAVAALLRGKAETLSAATA